MPYLTPEQMTFWEFVGKFAGGLTSLAVLGFAARTYYYNQKWKRAEFLAAEMKQFFASARVQKALILIDWGERRFDLLEGNPPGGISVAVTREMQVRGLIPHTLLGGDNADAEMMETDDSLGKDKGKFIKPEVAIRECYDAFLDGLERFASYVQTGLISKSSLRPYIGYWIEDIASPTENRGDAAWCATLLTYISFYRFNGVLWLFKEFGRDISPSSSIYREFLSRMVDKELASRLAGTVKPKAITKPRKKHH